jgi:L-malate glycosyltransferase
MKIFVVPSWYPDSENSLRGIFFKEQVHALKKEGMDIVVLYPEIWSIKTFIKQKPGVFCEIEEGIKTYRYKGYNFIPRVPWIAYHIYRARLKKLFSLAIKREGKPDLVHAHSLIWGGVAVAELAENHSIPLVVTEHSSAFGRGLLKPFHQKLIKRKVNSIRHFIAVSNSLKNDLSGFIPPEQIEVIPNIVDTEFFNISNKKRSKFTFFTLAMLKENKGIDVLIKAFSQKFKASEAELLIGGDGIEKRQLEDLAANLNIDKQVTFLGKLSRERTSDFMEQCDVFVLPSRYETFGVVYIEALSCGKPVIATKCGGPEMMVNKQNGLLVPVDHVEELGGAMSYVKENYQSYDPAAIRRECIEQYSEKAVTAKLINYYKEVVSG